MGGSSTENAFSGKNFCYRLLEDDPHGRPYLLYGVGLDGVDNGGSCSPHGAQEAFCEYRHRGFDYLLNPPPEE